MDSSRTKISLNNSKTIGIFQTYIDFATGSNAVWSPSLSNDLNMFYSGKLAMMIAPSWRAFDIIKSSSAIEFGTAPLPQLEANKNEVYYSTYWGEAVNKKSTNKELAWKFVKFLAEKEQQLKMYSNSSTIGERAFGEPYSLVELNSEMKGKAYVDAIATMAPYMKSWQLGDENFVRSAIEEAVTQIAENGKDVTTILRETENTINTRLAQTNK
jgi:ABC-type glycerol-3-phosphate transport system substrate-binding protein